MQHQFTKIASLLAIILLSDLSLIAQTEKELRIWSEQPDAISSIRFPGSVRDSIELEKVTRALKSELQSMGYLLTTIQVKEDSLYRELKIYPGTRYQLAYLSPGNLPEIVQSRVGYRERFYRSTPFNYKEIKKLFNRIIEYGENNGYPFASVQMDSVKIENGRFSGVVNYDPGPLISYDSLNLRGNLRIKPQYLSAYLQIKPGTVYSERKSARIEQRLASLNYLKVNSAVGTSFQNSMATHYLDLQHQAINQIDGIIGFLPNEREGNKLLVTGEFNLSLNNLFQTGKAIRMEWRSLRPESQYLHVRYDHPFIFRTPIGLNFDFDLLKEDSAFLNRNFRIEADYIPGIYSKIRFFTEFKNSGLLSSDSNPEESLLLADFDITTYGLGYSLNTTRNLIFPRSGWKLDTEVYLGNKTIRKNSNIDESFYDSLDLKSTQFYFTFIAQKFFQSGKRSVAGIKGSFGKIQNDQLFLNDLFRPGGLQSLRGFNERNFFASDYVILTAEWRYLMDKSSYFFIFYDQGFLSYDLNEASYKDQPSGIGVGLSLSSKAGIFNLVYALGRTQEQPFAFNLSKIHFGYISRF